MGDEYETLKASIKAIKELDGDTRQEEYVKELRAFHKTLLDKPSPRAGLRSTLYRSIERLLIYYSEGNMQKVQKECDNALRIAKAFYA